MRSVLQSTTRNINGDRNIILVRIDRRYWPRIKPIPRRKVACPVSMARRDPRPRTMRSVNPKTPAVMQLKIIASVTNS
jgi:hypothetical protein